jgi:hypothetical protein
MSAIATGGAVVPVLALGNRGYLMERTPVVKADQRFVVYAKAGWFAPWRKVASFLMREAACTHAESLCVRVGDTTAVQDTEPQGLFPVREQWRPGFEGPVRETIIDAGGKVVPQ